MPSAQKIIVKKEELTLAGIRNYYVYCGNDERDRFLARECATRDWGPNGQRALPAGIATVEDIRARYPVGASAERPERAATSGKETIFLSPSALLRASFLASLLPCFLASFLPCS